MVCESAVRLRPAAALAAALVLWSCTGDDAGIRRLPLEPAASPGVLTVSPNATTLAWIGATGRLTATISTSDGGSASGVRYTWTSLNPSVVTVDGSGRITSVAEGEGRVVASVLNLADTATVVVKRLPATVTLSADTVLITRLDAPVQLTAAVADGGGQALNSATVVWASTDTAVATVSSTGLVTPRKQGLATVSATAGSVRQSARVRVKIGPSVVAVTPGVVSMTSLGDTVRLAGAVLDARGDTLPDVTVTYQGVDTTVAHVTTDGLVTARGVGTTQVTAVGDTVRRSVQVTVTQVPASLTVSPDSVSLTPGGTQTFTAAVADARGNAIAAPTVTWTSGDTAVATVSAAGVATAKAAGRATIRATAGAATDTAVVIVVGTPVDSVVVSADSLALSVGDTARLTARFFSGGVEVLGPKATWMSDSTAVATVDSTGLVRAVAAGSAVITATQGTGADTVRVTVTAPAPATVGSRVEDGGLPALGADLRSQHPDARRRGGNAAAVARREGRR